MWSETSFVSELGTALEGWRYLVGDDSALRACGLFVDVLFFDLCFVAESTVNTKGGKRACYTYIVKKVLLTQVAP